MTVVDAGKAFELADATTSRLRVLDDLRDIPRIIPQTGGFESYGRLRLSEKIYKKGDVVLAFDVLLGDALFVDRMSYNFVRPKSGDPAVKAAMAIGLTPGQERRALSCSCGGPALRFWCWDRPLR